MKKSLIPLVTAAGIALGVLGAGTTKATHGVYFTTCSVSVDHDTVYASGDVDLGRSQWATFTVDGSKTLVKPADYYISFKGPGNTGTASPIQTTDANGMGGPHMFSWSNILGMATQGAMVSLSKPLNIDFRVSSFPTINNPYDCRTTVTLMPNEKPAAPTDVAATAGDASAVVVWAGADGFLGVSYKVTASPGGSWCVAVYPNISCTVDKLTNGTPYAFTVTAESSGGISDPSGESAPVTPMAGNDGSGDDGFGWELELDHFRQRVAGSSGLPDTR